MCHVWFLFLLGFWNICYFALCAIAPGDFLRRAEGDSLIYVAGAVGDV